MLTMKLFDGITPKTYTNDSVLSTFISSVFDKIRRKRLARQTYVELNRLSDRDLADIGICRGDIYYIAYGEVGGLL